VAALLPEHWELRLVDMNVEPLDDAALAWADVVMLSAMRIQAASFHDVARRAAAMGKRVVAGGPYVTSDPAAGRGIDHVVAGEAEDLLAALARDLEQGGGAARVEAPSRPDVRRTPVPRYDLLRIERYNAVGVQFSRGCPFTCEFCDIIELFGRSPRTKTPDQLLRELDAVYDTGFRGAVFLVDDNFIGNKVAAKKMLVRLAEWTRDHGHPFDLFTEASVNLADDDDLIDKLVAADFSAVFLGIETPSKDALLETQKRQNAYLDLGEAVDKLTRRGLEVYGGFIVGFDADDESVFDLQFDFIDRSPIAKAMVGILTALPSTQLWRRLAREGRLFGDSVGDTAYRPNFATRLPEDTLVSGYASLLSRLYAPEAFFRRAFRYLELSRDAPRSPFSRPFWHSAGVGLRSIWYQGVRASYRREYWRFLARVLRTMPDQWMRAMAAAIPAQHMIRYTFEDILPRLAAPAPARAPVAPPAESEGLVTIGRRALADLVERAAPPATSGDALQ
jgi:radical SAM superfamily enzyme YgiQ (UPF0313 family)